MGENSMIVIQFSHEIDKRHLYDFWKRILCRERPIFHDFAACPSNGFPDFTADGTQSGQLALWDVPAIVPV